MYILWLRFSWLVFHCTCRTQTTKPSLNAYSVLVYTNPKTQMSSLLWRFIYTHIQTVWWLFGYTLVVWFGKRVNFCWYLHDCLVIVRSLYFLDLHLFKEIFNCIYMSNLYIYFSHKWFYKYYLIFIKINLEKHGVWKNLVTFYRQPTLTLQNNSIFEIKMGF